MLSINPCSATIIRVFDGVGAGDLLSDWQAAVGVFAQEDFADNLWQGVTLSITGVGHTGFGILGGEFHDRLLPNETTTFSFASAITAFGANWDLSPGGTGLGIKIDAGGFLVPIEVPRTHAITFFGFISDVPFTQIVLRPGTQGGVAETYDLDDAVTAFAAVPEPSSFSVFALLTFASFRGMSRKNRAPYRS